MSESTKTDFQGQVHRALTSAFPDNNVRLSPFGDVHVKVEHDVDVVVDEHTDPALISISIEEYDPSGGLHAEIAWETLVRTPNSVSNVVHSVGGAILYVQRSQAS